MDFNKRAFKVPLFLFLAAVNILLAVRIWEWLSLINVVVAVGLIAMLVVEWWAVKKGLIE